MQLWCARYNEEKHTKINNKDKDKNNNKNKNKTTATTKQNLVQETKGKGLGGKEGWAGAGNALCGQKWPCGLGWSVRMVGMRKEWDFYLTPDSPAPGMGTLCSRQTALLNTRGSYRIAILS